MFFPVFVIFKKIALPYDTAQDQGLQIYNFVKKLNFDIFFLVFVPFFQKKFELKPFSGKLLTISDPQIFFSSIGQEFSYFQTQKSWKL